MHRIQISPTLQYTESNTKETKRLITETVIEIKVLVVGTGVGVERGGEGGEGGR